MDRYSSIILFISISNSSSCAQKHMTSSNSSSKLTIIIKRDLTCAFSSFLLLTFISSFFLIDFLHPFQYQYSQLSKVTGFFSQYLPSVSTKNNTRLYYQDQQQQQSPPPPGYCDYSVGRWVREEATALRFYDEDCPFLDPGFRCRRCGRPDSEYLNWRWQPDGCHLPRFNANDLLERSRNGRVVFAGDSIGRNQWESLICMLAQAVSNKSTIYEVNGNPVTKHKGFLCMRFAQYNLTVEYYRAPYLVVPARPPKNSPEAVKYAIRVDTLHWYSKSWAGADLLVFNDGHWWNADKTIKQGFYFQEGEFVNMTMNVEEAFRRSLQTWKKWVMESLDSRKTHVVFRSYSPVHYRDGTWDVGGRCDTSFEPESNYTRLEEEPWNNKFIHEVVKQVEDGYNQVQFLNITYLAEFRIDAHPSKYREPGTPQPAPQDCSHWCLPGVPDTWNEVLYANLLAKGFRAK
ncbi:unnamed protein product [Rhodiola kirilowii]